jgi:hypothetical protein
MVRKQMKQMKCFTCISLLLLLSLTSFSQKEDPEKIVEQYADSIKTIAPAILNGSTDSIRNNANKEVIRLLEVIMHFKESYTYPFDSLKTIAHLIAPDKSFRIYNWILPHKDGTFKFYGYVQQYNKKTKLVTFTVLNDASDKIEKVDKAILNPEKWYGCLYYKILLNKFLGKRYYTLLGWKGYTLKSTKKVIDVLTFVANKPKFGQAIFKVKKEVKCRLILQYSSQAVVSLRYVDDEKAIVCDHLSPPSDNLKGQFEFYGPDFTYDALKFKRGKWFLTEYFIAKNEKDPSYKKPRKQPVHIIPIRKE